MNRTTILAVVVFAGLVAATAFSMRQKPERGITRFSFAAVVPAEVDRVVISGPNAIELKRDGDAWKAGDKPADPDAVSRLLDSIHRMESSELETRNAERYADMQVDDEKGARVQVFSKGRTLADFVVGSSASGGAHVRAADGVYAVKGIFPGTFSRTRSAWLERRLFADKLDDVTRVEIALSGQKPWALVRQDNAWRLEDPALLGAGDRFDAQAAGSLVQQLVSGRALDVLDQDPGAEASGLADSADKISYQTAGATARELRLGKDAEGGTVYGRVSTRPDVLTLPSSFARALRKQPADLRDLTLMAFDPSAATRLSVTRDGKKVVFEKTNNKWKVAESSDPVAVDFDLDDGAVARRVAAVAGIRALAEADASAAGTAGLGQPAAVASVTLKDGKVVELAFGAETKRGDDNAAFARGNADERVYLVRTSVRDGVLNTALDTFAKRAGGGAEGFANLDPSKLDSLPPDVRQAIQKKIDEEKQKQRLMEAVQKQKPPAAHP